ncbi:pheromone A receptor-domain-containing protein [Truncatella angustata]|uniref:Pheromone A receptor-domain-containing protein n=1 Tax=Truncatella angustata TaxID=152316 RepID=A0A9P8UL94_9PEZI|nr:pheromone A receptor-domain-containing protein [Truncatella angustata]KAH6654253.1 pheromone A receptor-domain-containing protein [Truncatella angustata]
MSDPGLAANRILRTFFAILGTILCWVPFRLLARNGEFVVVVFIIDVVIANVFTVLNASIWPDDDMAKWWDGTGLCDFQAFITFPLDTLYAACIFAIMRNLAQRLRLKRANNLTPPERRRRMLVQSLIIFPVPIVQLALMWFVTSNRYAIAPVIGCLGAFDTSWFKVAVLGIPPATFAVATIPYAFLTWKRFREISKTTKVALTANTRSSSRVRQRTRIRLYQMALSIIVPYVPLQMVFFGVNLTTTMRNLHPYNYYSIHHNPDHPWSAIIFYNSWDVAFSVMNQPWINIFTTIPIVLFFGMTDEANEAYRRFLTRLRIGSWWNASKNVQSVVKETSEDSTLPPSELPNPHRQTIVTSAGPFIPPRHSSKYWRQ